MSDTKNQVAWVQLFSKYGIAAAIEQEGKYHITASQINIFREARLMTKFDHYSQLPPLFQQLGISILPTARGHYILARMQTFHPFKTRKIGLSRIEFPSHLTSIDYHRITSESVALNCAYISGMLADFVEEEQLLPTVNGRMSSSHFDFEIDNVKKQTRLGVQVENAQLEIDGGYEGKNALYLIEVKNTISDDFVVRQLYYPYRLWTQRIEKPVRTLFLTYTNGIFHFRAYDFAQLTHYNSIHLIKEKKYILRERAITRSLIEEILKKVAFVEEPTIPFPQADSFERVINVCELIQEERSLTKEFITANYDFDKRQTDYYTSAARYLGLVEKRQDEHGVQFILTAQGHAIFTKKMAARQLAFIEIILSHKVFHLSLSRTFVQRRILHKDEIVAIMKASNLYKVGSDSTYRRRASTVSRWTAWILAQIEDLVLF